MDWASPRWRLPLALMAVLLLAGCSSAGTPAVSEPPLPSPSASMIAPTAMPSPTTTATPAPCSAFSIRITSWDGAAGSRIGHVSGTNAGTVVCPLPATVRAQLVDGAGKVLIDGVGGASPSPAAPSAAPPVLVSPGGSVTTLVRASNYCGTPPAAPVTIRFVFADGTQMAATPFSSSDTTVPPCLGATGSAGTVEMQPWSP